MAHILSYRETVQLVRDFRLFSKAQKYNIQVWQSRHPLLSEYLGRVLECIEEEMLKGTIRRVILVIKEANLEGKPLERFVFDFEWLIADQDIPRNGDDWTPKKRGLAQGDVEDLLRACLLKLNFSESALKRLPADLSFAVLLEMKDDAPPPESKAAKAGNVPAEWIPAEARHATEEDGSGPGRGGPADGTSTVSPLERVRFGMISMDIRVEETAEKFETDELFSSGETGGVAIHKMDRKGKGRAA